MENTSNRTSHELYHGRVNSILKMGRCAYGPINAIDPLPKGLDVHTNGSNLDCVVATTSISLLSLHPRCDSPLSLVSFTKMEMPQTPKEFCILPNSVPMHVDHLDMRCMTLSCHPSWGCSCNQVF
jgi:hypothetical protein